MTGNGRHGTSAAVVVAAVVAFHRRPTAELVSPLTRSLREGDGRAGARDVHAPLRL